jgi:hypothetical protein
MTTSDPRNSNIRPTDTRRDVRGGFGGDETKPSWKSTELYIYLLAVIGVLIASYMVGEGDSSNDSGEDIFAADKAWWYITLLTVGYLVSRGLAKSGSRTRGDDSRTD